MKTLCGLVAAAALLVGASAPAAGADSTGPMAGLEAICLMQGGDWYPTGWPGFPYPGCSGVNFGLWPHVPSSYASNQLEAADSLCKAIGWRGVLTYGKGIIDLEGRPGTEVVTWGCI